MDSDSSSTHESYARALRAYAEAAGRDPRAAGCGYLAGDPATRAVGAFVWFPTPAEMFAFLAGPEVDLLRFGDEDARRMAASVQRTLRGVGALARVDRNLLSACFEGWSEIVWLGSFMELCERGGAFPTDARAAFRRARGTGDHAGPIADDERDAFVTWLRAYGS
jgi:hypothetical protein